MTAFTQHLADFEQQPYVELFDIDLTTIGGTTVYHLIPSNDTTQDIVWRGETYTPFPIEATGFVYNGDNTAPPRPTLTVSNVNGYLMGVVVTLGDIVGAKVTRWRTFTQFLDGHPDADPDAHFMPDVFYINQKTYHDKTKIQWSLIHPLDRPNKLPRRQILKDPTTTYGVYFPGVARTRKG